MPTTTPLNGWPVPVSTDLVKDGAEAIEDLGDAIDASVGSGLLAWQTYAPTLSGGWANGNGTYSVAKYCKIGKTVIVKVIFVVGSTTTKGTDLIISLPVTNTDINTGYQGARLRFASTNYIGITSLGSTTATLGATNASGNYTITAVIVGTGGSPVPALVSTNDNFSFTLVYETSA
jgi:hypothetical protein